MSLRPNLLLLPLLTAFLDAAPTRLDDSYLVLEKRLQPFPAWATALITVAAVLLIAIALWALLRWRKHRAALAAIPPTPYEVALSALQALLSEELPQRGETKLFHQRLSGILRQYLEDRFQISAPHLTTEEFLEILSGTPSMVREHRVLLQEFLNACDMVKFAGRSSGMPEMDALTHNCRQFLEHTRQTDPPDDGQPQKR